MKVLIVEDSGIGVGNTEVAMMIKRELPDAEILTGINHFAELHAEATKQKVIILHNHMQEELGRPLSGKENRRERRKKLRKK